jgi:hypothetical protein
MASALSILRLTLTTFRPFEYAPGLRRGLRIITPRVASERFEREPSRLLQTFGLHAAASRETYTTRSVNGALQRGQFIV